MFKEYQMPFAKALIRKLKEVGVTEVRVWFDGSGDSGSIESIDFAGNTNPTDMVEWLEIKCHYDKEKGDWIEERRTATISIKNAVEAFCYDALGETGVDWYNNDGGYGELTIELDPVKVTLVINTRYTQVESTSFDFNGNLEEVNS